MSSVNVLPVGFTALMAMTVMTLAVGVAVLVQRVRRKPLRGPLVAFVATALAYLGLVIADQVRFSAPGAAGLLRLADDWALAWAPVAALLWWLAGPRPPPSGAG
jgi:hypothetical protein